MPDWPKLLRLYSRMKPGKTVLEWMNEHNVHQLGIDVRRFTSFGVIKVSSCNSHSQRSSPLGRDFYAESTDTQYFFPRTLLKLHP